MKRFVCILLSLVILIGLVPVVSLAATPPTLTGAHPINDTQLLITFSEPVVLNFSKSTRFAMRVIDGNNNMASGTTDAYQTMAEGKYTWANEAHTALIWTIASGTGHPATVAHWKEVAQAQQANGNRVCFAIIDLATSGDANVDAVTAVSSGAVMQKMNTSGAGMAVVEMTDRQALTLTSAAMVSDTQVDLTFSEPIKISGKPFLALRVVDPETDKIVNVSGNQLLAQQPVLTLSEDGRTLSWKLTNVSLADWMNKKETYPQYKIKVCLLENPTNVNGKIDQITDVYGGSALTATYSEAGNREAACIELTDGIPVVLEKAEIINASQIELSFSRPIAISGNPFVALRIVDPETDKIISSLPSSVNQMLAQQPVLSLDETKQILTWTLTDVNLDGWMARKTQYPEYAVKVCILENPTNVNGRIDQITNETKTAALAATYSESGMREAACVELTKKKELKLESASAIDNHTIVMNFSEPIKLNGTPLLALRIVDPETDKIVSELSSINQMLAQKPQLTLSEDGRSLTWTFSVDVSVWVNRQTAYPQYAVKVCILESVVAVNGVIDQVTDAAGQIGVSATYSETGNREAACIRLTDSRPAVEAITLNEVTMIDDGHIGLTFSAPVVISGNPQIAVALVDGNNKVVFNKNGSAQVYLGRWESDPENDCRIIWRPLFVNAQGVKSLAELFAFGGTASEFAGSGYVWKFRIAEVTDAEISVVNGNGYIENLKGVDGKPVRSNWIDPQAVAAESVFMDVNHVYPENGLTVISVQAIDDGHIDITFSAPVERHPGTAFLLRLVDETGAILTNQDGEYLQWSGTWVFANEEQTRIRWRFTSKNKFGINNLNDLFAYKGIEVYRDYDFAFYIGESSSDWGQNGVVDNIYLKDDPTVHLTANQLAGFDALLLPIEMAYQPRSITVEAKVINEQQVMLTFSEPVMIVGDDPFMCIRYMRYGEQYFDGEFNNSVTVQFDGNWEWADSKYTQILWTMKGINRYGGYNLYDVFHRSNGLARFDDATIAFCIEEVYDIENGLRPGTDLVDNVVSLDGTNHLSGVYSTKIGGPDRCYVPLSYGLSDDLVKLEKVVAIDDQTLELYFSEEVVLKEGDGAPTMGIRYVSDLGVTGVVVDGKSAYFRGNYTYKEGNRKIIVWKLDTEKARGAKNLTEIFNFEGNLRFNNDLNVVFAIIDDEKNLGCTWDMRVDGVTDLTGTRKLVATRVNEAGIVFQDIEIAYELPAPTYSMQGEEPDETNTILRTDYTVPCIIGGAILIVLPLGVGLATRKRKGGQK